jgi:outer membrane protein TolC
MSSVWNSRICGSIALALASVLFATPMVQAADGAAPSGPLSLEQCSRIALTQNPRLVSSRQAVVGAEAQLARARSPYYPQIVLEAAEEVARVESIADDSSASVRTERVDLALSQTLWQSGLRDRVEESRSRLTSTELDYAGDVQSLLQEVAGNYYGVLAADRLVAVQEAGVDSAARHLREVQARIEVGVAAEVDEFTVRDDLARAELALVDAQRDATVALARLKTTMGLSPVAPLELAEAEPAAPMLLPTLPEALTIAEQNRPDLLSAAASVEAARSAFDQARISRGPITDVSADYNWGYTDWRRRDPCWSLGLRLSWPLFDGYASEADVTSARANQISATAQLQTARNEAGLEVETALAEVHRSQTRVQATAASVAAADARLRAAEGKYQQGVGILLEVTDARAALTDALAGQVRAEYDYRTALVALERALGTLSPPAPEAPGN